MPRVPIASEYRTGEGGDRFPKLKMKETGEKARYTLIEQPWREYVHLLKAPTFDDDGLAQKETKTRRDKSTYSDYVMEFVSQPICLGDAGALQDKGIDEDNCPACAASASSGGDVPGPVQRFSVNVIRYELKGNTWDIRAPFSAQILIWAFGGRIYDEIEGIQTEIGDLRQHDITLECEDPYWQRNKLAFKMEPGYRGAPPGYIKELAEARASDSQLRDACGRDATRAQIDMDVQHVLTQWRRVRAAGSAAEVPQEFRSKAADLSTGIDELLAEEASSKSAPPPSPESSDDPFGQAITETTPAKAAKPEESAADLFTSPPAPEKPASPGAAAVKEPASEAAAATTPSAPPSSEGGDFDFESLLGL